MSGVTVTFYPQGGKLVVIDGKTVFENVNVSSETTEIGLPWSVTDTDPYAGVVQRYLPGITTWTLSVGDRLLFRTNIPPFITKTAEFVRYSWGVR